MPDQELKTTEVTSPIKPLDPGAVNSPIWLAAENGARNSRKRENQQKRTGQVGYAPLTHMPRGR